MGKDVRIRAWLFTPLFSFLTHFRTHLPLCCAVRRRSDFILPAWRTLANPRLFSLQLVAGTLSLLRIPLPRLPMLRRLPLIQILLPVPRPLPPLPLLRRHLRKVLSSVNRFSPVWVSLERVIRSHIACPPLSKLVANSWILSPWLSSRVSFRFLSVRNSSRRQTNLGVNR